MIFLSKEPGLVGVHKRLLRVYVTFPLGEVRSGQLGCNCTRVCPRLH